MTSVAIGAPLDRVWAALLDVPRVAAAAGATVEGSAGVDGHRVRLHHRAGVVRLEEADDDEHVARFRATGPAGSATVTARLAADGDATRLHLDAGVPLGDAPERFAAALDRDVRDAPPGDATPGAALGHALDPIADVAGPLAERGVIVLAGAALGFLAGWLARGRR